MSARNNPLQSGGTVVFVDSQISDYQAIVSAIGSRASVIVFDGTQDGLHEIAQQLAGVQGLSAIDIISHGSVDAVRLGTDVLTTGNISDHAADLAAIGKALAPDGQIDLYGCDVAAGGDGLLAALKAATGNDVAASTDSTGATALGGNWTLEASTGAPAAPLPADMAALQSFNEILLTPTAPIHGATAADTVQINDTATDDAGDIFVTGTFSGTAFFDGTTSLTNAHPDIINSLVFVAKYNSSGALQWVRDFTGAVKTSGLAGGNNDTVNSIAVTPDGTKVYVGGQFVGTIDFDSTHSVSAGFSSGYGSFGMYIAQFDGSGNYQWNTTGYVANSPSLVAETQNLATDASGNVFAIGRYDAAFTLHPVSGSGSFSAPTSQYDAFILELSSAGAVDWTARIDSQTASTFGFGLAIDSSDNVYISGDTLNANFIGSNSASTNVQMPTYPLPGGFTGQDYGGFLAKLNSSGVFQWETTIPTTTPLFQAPTVDAIAVDQFGPVIVGTYVDNTVINGTTLHTTTGSYFGSAYSSSRVFVEQFDGSGNAKWARTESDSGSFAQDKAHNIVVDAVGNLVVTGTVGDSAAADSFDGHSITPPTAAYNSDPFIWTIQPGSSSGSTLFAGSFPSLESSGAFNTVGGLVAASGGGVTALLNIAGRVDADPGAGSTSVGTSGLHSGALLKLTASNIGSSAPNTAPVANADSYSTNEDTQLVVNTTGAGVLQNDTDADSDPIHVASHTNPTHGTLTLNTDGSFTYTPNANFQGSDSFTYIVNDGTADSATSATVTITVNSVNDAPQGTSKTLTINEDSPHTFTAADFGFSDPNDNPTNTLNAVEITTLPLAGSLTDDGIAVTALQFVPVADITGGKLIYTPAADAGGTPYASFTFQVQDNGGTGNGGADTDPTPRTMTFDVTAVNDAPVLSNLDASGPTVLERGSAVVVDNNVTVSDVDLDAFNGGAGDYEDASLTIARHGGADASDTFGFNTTGASFTVSGTAGSGNLLSGGVSFATYTYSGGTLTVNFADTGATKATTALVDDVLAHITYANTSHDPPATVQLDYTFSDGNTGTQGSGGVLTALASSTLTITPINDAPTLTATASNPSFTEPAGLGTQAAAVALFTGAAASAIEASQSIVELDLSVSGLVDGANETLSIDGSTISLGASSTGTTATNLMDYTVTVVGGTATIVLTDNTGIGAAAADALIDGITYQNTSADDPTAGNRVVTLTSIKDSGGIGNGGADTTALSIAATITVAATNDTPTATITPASYSATEQVSLNLKTAGLTVGDVDGNSGIETATLSVTEGTLSVGAGTSGANVSGSGTSSVTITGTAAQIDALLNYDATSTVSYIDNTDVPGTSATLTLAIDDGGNTGSPGAKSASDTATINIAAVNDGPAAAITPTSYGATEQTNLTLQGSGLSVSDVDAGSGSETVTLSVGEGIITVNAGNSGVTGLSGSGSSTVSFSGTLAQLNNLLGGIGTGTILYNDNTNTPGASTQLTLTINDNAHTGSGGAKTASDTATINLTATNDTPDLTPNSPAANTFVIGSASPIALLSGGAVADPDSPANFLGGSFTLAITSGADAAHDQIVLVGPQFHVSGGSLLDASNNTIASISGLNSTSVSLTNLTSAATPSVVDALVQAFGFETSSTSTADRTVSFTFKDGGNTGGSAPGLQDAVTETVHLTTPPSEQIYFRINMGQFNEIQLGDINNDGTGRNTIYFGGGNTTGTSQGNETSVAVDTAAGLVFSVGIGNQGSYDAFSVHNLYTGALIETIEFGPNTGSANTDDIVNALTIDTATHTVYVGDWGTALSSTGVAQFSYNPVSGLVTPFTTGHGSTSITTTIAGGSSTTTTAGGIYLFSATEVPQYTNANALFLDTANHKLYFTNDDFGYNISPFSPTNAVYVTDTTTFATTQLTSLIQFPAANQPATTIGAHGSIVVLAVDVADGIVFFETTDTEGSPNIGLWWVNTTGANQTAHQIALPAGVTLNFAGQVTPGGDFAGLTFNAATNELYLSDTNNDVTTTNLGRLFDLHWDNATKTVSLVTSYDVATLVGMPASQLSPEDAISFTTLDNLPVLTGVSGTSTHAVEQGAAVTLLTGAPTIADSDGGQLASATVQITGGTFSSNENSSADDQLSVLGQTSGTIAGTNITVTWTAATETLTLSGDDTIAHYQTVLSHVQYAASGDNPTNYGADPTRTITWQVNDGAVGNPVALNIATTYVGVDAVNDAPAAAITPASYAATEQTALNLKGTGLAVSDVDGGSAIETVTLSVVEGTLNVTAGTSGAAVSNSGTSSVTISGTLAQINALLTSDANSTVSYIDNSDAPSANTTLTLAINDGGNTGSGGAKVGSDTATINITAVNDAPVAVDDVYAGLVDTQLAGSTVLVNDTDADTAHGSLTAAKVAGPSHGTLTFNSTGTFTYTPDSGFTGSDYFTYKTNDGALDSNVATVTINVGSSPVSAVTDSYSTDEDAALVVAVPGVLGNDSDSNSGGNPLTATVGTGPAHGSLTLNLDGSFTYTPNADFNGSDSFTYVADDGTYQGTGTVNITVNAVNDAPVNTAPASVTASEDVAFSFTGANTISISDIDAGSGDETVTLTVTDGKLHLGTTAGLSSFSNDAASIALTGTVSNVNSALASLSYLGNQDFNGPDSLSIVTSDGGNTGADPSTVGQPATGTASDEQASSTVGITVDAVNDAPAVDLNGPAAGTGVTLGYTEDDAATAIAPAGAVTDVDSTNFNGGSLTVHFAAGGAAEDQLSIMTDGQVSVSSGVVSVAGLAVGTVSGGVDGADLVISFNTDDATAAAISALIDHIAYADNSENPSTAARSVSFTVVDGDGGTDTGSATATVNVTSVNDQPTQTAPTQLLGLPSIALAIDGIVFSDVDSGGASEQAHITADAGTVAAASSGGVIATPDGPGGVFLVGTIANLNNYIAAGNVTLTAVTNTTVHVTLDDQGHTGTPGAQTSDTSDITIIVDQPPTTPADTDATADSVVEGAATGSAVGITANSTDPDGPTIAYSLTNDAGGYFQIDASTGVVTVSALGAAAIDFESAPGHAYTITVEATDDQNVSTTQDFVVAVTDAAPSAPADGDAATANSVAEGAASGTYTGLTASSTDVNGGTVTYSLNDDAG